MVLDSLQPRSEPRRATYADLEALPETVTGELIDGELYASPRPATGHGHAELALGAALLDPFGRGRGGPGGWIILPEPEIHLGPDVFVPDLAGWCRTRLPELPQAPHLELVPDWICEIHSPATRALDRVKKLRKYAQHGVAHLWFVDPAGRFLEVLRLDGPTYLLAASFLESEKVRAEPFEAIEIELALLWSQ